MPARPPKIPKPQPHSFYGRPLPEVRDARFSGKLLVLEGADGSGRSTQIQQLSAWLEETGYAVRHMGLRRSPLLAADIELAKQSTALTHTTMSLFYATDFFDQLIHEIIPALRAGYIVLADRYIYTLMARDLVRGADREWTRNLYSPAIVPGAVFYLKVPPMQLVQRNFQKDSSLDFWESGMDLGLSRDMFDSFLEYQNLLQRQFTRMQKTYDFTIVDASRPTKEVQQDLRAQISPMLGLPLKS